MELAPRRAPRYLVINSILENIEQEKRVYGFVMKEARSEINVRRLRDISERWNALTAIYGAVMSGLTRLECRGFECSASLLDTLRAAGVKHDVETNVYSWVLR